MKPNFFIAGAPKSGTSALAHYLSEHPRVFFTQPKEPFFWCQDFPHSKSLHAMHDLSCYRELFRNVDTANHLAVGEGSTTYLQSASALPAIREYNSEAKVIVMLRNPIEMVVGMHGELLRQGFENQVDFATAWDLQSLRREGKNLPLDLTFCHQLQYRDVARYPAQINRLFATFPATQRHVILFDDFRDNTALAYHRVLEFLGLPDDQRTEFPIVHAAKAIRYPWLAKLQRDPPPLVRQPFERFKSWYYTSQGPFKRQLQAWLFRKTPREAISTATKTMLVETFRKDIDELSVLLDRDLTHWLTEARV